MKKVTLVKNAILTPQKGRGGAKKGQKLAKSVKQCQNFAHFFADILRPVILLETCSKVIFRIAPCISNKMGGLLFLRDKYFRFYSDCSRGVDCDVRHIKMLTSADILWPVIPLETCSKFIFRIAPCISNKMRGQPFLGDKFSRFSSYFSKRGIFPKKCRKSANQLSKKCWRRRKNDVIGKILTSFQSLMIVPISCPVDTHQTSFCG